MPKPTGKNKGRSYHPPLLMSAHGIRTHGEWQKLFASATSGTQARTESFDYGRYGLFRFTVPPFNSRLVDKFYNWYGTTVKTCASVALDRYDKRPSAVAHSLGSWVIANAMLKYEDVRFDKLILAGSILPRDFDWATLFARDQVAFVRNECGQKDPWPDWAGRFVARTGTGGTHGFDWFGSTVQNVRCDWFGHSDALMRTHIETQWLPLLFQVPCPLVVLHGRHINDRQTFAKILDDTATIDSEAYGKLPHYPEVEIPRGLSLTWIRVNPDIYTFLTDRQTGMSAGYINAMPVDDKLYQGIRSGTINDNQVSADGIAPYVDGASVKIYLMSIAIAEKYRRWGDGIMQQAYVQLITGFLDKLIYYAKNHDVCVTHFLATAWTAEGKTMCKLLGMEPVSHDQFGDTIYELDLRALDATSLRKALPALRRLVRLYQELTP